MTDQDPTQRLDAPPEGATPAGGAGVKAAAGAGGGPAGGDGASKRCVGSWSVMSVGSP